AGGLHCGYRAFERGAPAIEPVKSNERIDFEFVKKAYGIVLASAMEDPFRVGVAQGGDRAAAIVRGAGDFASEFAESGHAWAAAGLLVHGASSGCGSRTAQSSR